MNILPAVRTDFKHPALLQRIQTISPGDSDLLLFRVFEDGEECALVTLRPDDDYTIDLEEIFLISGFRGRGLGATIIENIIEICRGLGKGRITVWAHPLDDNDDDAKVRLIKWYERCGFSCCGAWDELERFI